MISVQETHTHHLWLPFRSILFFYLFITLLLLCFDAFLRNWVLVYTVRRCTYHLARPV